MRQVEPDLWLLPRLAPLYSCRARLVGGLPMDATSTVKPKRRLSIARIVIWGFVALAVGWYFTACSGKTVSSAITGPGTLANERVQLHRCDAAENRGIRVAM